MKKTKKKLQLVKGNMMQLNQDQAHNVKGGKEDNVFEDHVMMLAGETAPTIFEDDIII